MIGTVKFFNHDKQFGFIATEGGDYFFHGNNVIGEMPVARDIVEFWLTDDPRRTGVVATEVRLRSRAKLDRR